MTQDGLDGDSLMEMVPTNNMNTSLTYELFDLKHTVKK